MLIKISKGKLKEINQALSNIKFQPLAVYNAECARGIMHTDSWARQMDELQEEYNKIMMGK